MEEATGANPTRMIAVAAGEQAPPERVAGLGLRERWKKVAAKYGLEFDALDAAALPAALASVDAPVVLCDERAVVDEMALERLLLAEPTPDVAVGVRAPGLPRAPVMCIGMAAARRLGADFDATGPSGVEPWLDRLDADEQTTVRAEELPRSFWTVVADDKAAKAATWGLLRELRWRPGGVVAKHINRPISLQISRHLLDTPISPNAVTLFAGLVGAVGIVFIVLGGWLNAVIGTGLLQLNSIIDGIDGELARMRQQTSEFGAYLDSVVDEILNSALMIAVGYHLWNATGWLPYLILGIFAGTMVISYAGLHWHCKWKHGLGFYWWFEAYKPRKEVQRSTSPFAYLKKLFWKESYLLLYFIAAIAGVLPVMLYFSSAGGLLALVLMVIHIGIKRARW